MRLLSFDRGGRAVTGVRLGDEVVDLSLAAPELPQDIRGLLTAGQPALEAAARAAERAGPEARLPLAGVHHRVPISHPDKIIGLGKNYVKHVAEMGAEAPIFPGMFFRVPDSLTPHNGPIWRPAISDTLDYEGELMIVIGRQGWNIPKARALDYVAGYTVHNDGSVREYNYIPAAVTAGKNFLHTGGVGPEIITADELPPGARGLRLTTHVNDELRQDGNTADMHWGVADLVHLMSRIFTLYPGDLIGTGTPSGCAAAMKPPKWLKAGDVVTVEIEGIGKLVNPIVEAPTGEALAAPPELATAN